MEKSGRQPGEGMNLGLGESGRQKPLLPGSKNLCAFASKMAPAEPKMPLLTELENLFGLGGYKYFAPTALPATSSIPQRIGQAAGINDRVPRLSRPTCVIPFSNRNG
jgi:hypothetical protein